MIIRPITLDDLDQCWGGIRAGRTVRGFAVEHDGRIMGIAFLMYLPKAICAFAEMCDGGQQFPLTIMRVAHKMRALMQTVSAPVFAVADEQYPNSGAFLERCGFEYLGGLQYVFKNERG